jgi:hypothetical protein
MVRPGRITCQLNHYYYVHRQYLAFCLSSSHTSHERRHTTCRLLGLYSSATAAPGIRQVHPFVSLKHCLLSNIASKPPPYSSPSSVSRSQTSRDEMLSMADKMLQASLTRGGASAAVSSSSVSPPSYSRSAAVPTPPERNSAASRPRPPVLGGTATTLPDSVTLCGYSKKRDPDSKSSSVSSISSSSSTVSAADSKAKVREFQRESQ